MSSLLLAQLGGRGPLAGLGVRPGCHRYCPARSASIPRCPAGGPVDRRRRTPVPAHRDLARGRYPRLSRPSDQRRPAPRRRCAIRRPGHRPPQLPAVRVGDLVEQWYAVRDAGAALGDTTRWAPRTNHIESFERAPFIVGVNQGHVDFAYKGAHRDLVDDRISPADVAWISNWLGRLSDRQWRDAFRAGGYEPAVAARFIKRLRDKVSQGRALDYSWRKASTGSSAEAARAGQ